MPYDTEADFVANYRITLMDPDTGWRFYNFKSPDFNNGNPVTVRVGYCRAGFYAGKEKMADRVIAHSNITADDSIILFGGAFGWLGEWIEQKTGAAVVSVDVSTWVNATQNDDQDIKIQEAIEADGLTISSGPGKYIYDKLKDPGPACRISGGVINEDLKNNGSRQRVIAKLPRNPTLIITEEVWQVLTDAEKTEYTTRLTNFGIPVLHIIDQILVDGP